MSSLGLGFRAVVERGYCLVRINKYESLAYINLSSEHISGGYFDYRQLLIKGFCEVIGEFHANKTMENIENPIFMRVLLWECLIFCLILIILDLYKRVYV